MAKFILSFPYGPGPHSMVPMDQIIQKCGAYETVFFWGLFGLDVTVGFEETSFKR